MYIVMIVIVIIILYLYIYILIIIISLLTDEEKTEFLLYLYHVQHNTSCMSAVRT